MTRLICAAVLAACLVFHGWRSKTWEEEKAEAWVAAVEEIQAFADALNAEPLFDGEPL